MKRCSTTPRYILIGYPGAHDTIVAKSLLKTSNIAFIFIKEAEVETALYRIKKLPAVRLVEAPSMAIADGIDEIKSWLQAS